MGRRVAGILVVLLCVVAAACSSGSDTGTVKGRLLAVGGLRGTARPVDGTVTATFSDGRRVKAQVSRNGRFTMHGHTGHVKVRGRSPRFNGGQSPCFGPKTTVKASTTVTADVLCQMH